MFQEPEFGLGELGLPRPTNESRKMPGLDRAIYLNFLINKKNVFPETNYALKHVNF